MANSTYKSSKIYIKFLAICSDSNTIKNIIKSCQDKVIKIVCNAALNIYCGDIALSRSQKQIFSKYRKLIKILADLHLSLDRKRRVLIRNSNSKILSLIISVVQKIFGDKIYK